MKTRSICLNLKKIIHSQFRSFPGNMRHLMVTAFVLISAQVSSGQCNTDGFLDKCASSLGTYNYIKSFVSYASPRKKSSPESNYVFSKGSTYKMIACTEKTDGGRMVIMLFDRDHNLIASTYDQKSKKYFSELQYPCSATGVYYIKTTFEGTKSGCGMCILGFSKD